MPPAIKKEERRDFTNSLSSSFLVSSWARASFFVMEFFSRAKKRTRGKKGRPDPTIKKKMKAVGLMKKPLPNSYFLLSWSWDPGLLTVGCYFFIRPSFLNFRLMLGRIKEMLPDGLHVIFIVGIRMASVIKDEYKLKDAIRSLSWRWLEEERRLIRKRRVIRPGSRL